MPPPVERKPRFSRWAGRIHEYFRAYSSMIEPVRSVEPSSTIIHSAGRMLCAATASMVAPMNSSSSRTGVIMQYVTDAFGRVATLIDICPLGKLCSTWGELDNERPPFEILGHLQDYSHVRRGDRYARFILGKMRRQVAVTVDLAQYH